MENAKHNLKKLSEEELKKIKEGKVQHNRLYPLSQKLLAAKNIASISSFLRNVGDKNMHTFGADYFIHSDIVYLFLSSICFFKISSKKKTLHFLLSCIGIFCIYFKIRILMIFEIVLMILF